MLLSLSREKLPQRGCEVWQRYVRAQKIKFVFKYDLILQNLGNFSLVSLNFGLIDIFLPF